MSKLYVFVSIVVLVLGFSCMPGLFGVARRLLTTMATEYVSGTYSMALVTAPSEDVGKKLAKGLVQSKLAACVNIVPGIKSVYEWEGKIEEDAEILLIIKTRSSRIEELSKYVTENHPYDVPEVISFPIENGSTSYLNWIGQIVQDKTNA